jgi:hypothetical protein
MTIILRMRQDLGEHIRADLQRRHPFAHERVGFISARIAHLAEDGLVVFAEGYHPVDDGDYLDDPTVGAMMASSAIRKALELAYVRKLAMIHVHMHDHTGPPAFSSVDLRESAKFMPNFFHVAPRLPHCAVVLSADRAIGLCWRPGLQKPVYIDRIVEVGAPLRISRRR